MKINMGDVEAASDVLLACAGRQGATETPELWNRYLGDAIAKARSVFAAEGLGLRFEGDGLSQEDFTIDVQFWADDVYLYGGSRDMCKRMFEILSTEFAAKELRWKPDSLCFIDNTEVHEGDVDHVWATDVGEYVVKGVPRLLALGVMLDRDGSTMPSVKHRFSSFWASWAS
jgi:hypothetical protein